MGFIARGIKRAGSRAGTDKKKRAGFNSPALASEIELTD